ncbi:DUF1294 domain-containing protein [Novosphingobium sp. AP12]|uniref:DUF1294 domain-containing protein n=1 Tax=Novosphingobium sp. AP12 TaxID=1144305 RepID=UPI0002720612|nr:DUF1294 domain-containing protein [Novosphingobium sp. AP12]EJL21183.1 putative membrane protein [Novosphingobium sp. AP12]
MTPLDYGIAGLAALNAATFLAFAIDKARARRHGRRIAERTLLMLALVGGSPGAYAGRRAFRHKTRKQPFVGRLHAIAALQVAGIGTAAYLLR